MRIEPLACHAACVAVLARWHHDEWHGLLPQWSHSDALAELEAHATGASPDTTLVALGDDDELLGSVSLLTDDSAEITDFSPWLASLFVRPDARRRGVGRELVDALVAEAAKRGVPELFLFTPDASAWYRSLGWRDRAQRRSGGRAVTVMSIAPAVARP